MKGKPKMRTTQRELKEMVKYENVIDLTYKDFDTINQYYKDENGFIKIALSYGQYGMNGALLEGYKTKKKYVITARSSALFQTV